MGHRLPGEPRRPALCGASRRDELLLRQRHRGRAVPGAAHPGEVRLRPGAACLPGAQPGRQSPGLLLRHGPGSPDGLTGACLPLPPRDPDQSHSRRGPRAVLRRPSDRRYRGNVGGGRSRGLHVKRSLPCSMVRRFIKAMFLVY